ncbi:hypothetical protein ACQ4LE_008397 [Meloidogyne hapla]
MRNVENPIDTARKQLELPHEEFFKHLKKQMETVKKVKIPIFLKSEEGINLFIKNVEDKEVVKKLEREELGENTV